MGARFEEGKTVISRKACSKLLELAATDDLAAFVHEAAQMGSDVDQAGYWYCRSFGPAAKMRFLERTPIMVAALCGSTQVLKHIIATRKVDLNRAAGSDGATALHCAAAGGSCLSVELLIDASADVDALDSYGRKPGDLTNKLYNNSNKKTIKMLLNGVSEPWDKEEEDDDESRTPRERREYPVDVSLPDINNGLYGTDEFRMYSFKVKPCSRAYSHDWTECPFVHPGENARRRDPRKYHYTCVPCPEFKKGSCARGDSCEYAHGVFESWLHPAQYRTRLCKDETGCPRKVCFFAHRPEDLRPLYASTGSGMPSPKSVSINSPLDMSSASLSPLNLGSPFKIPNTSTPPMSPSVTCSSPMGGGMWQNNLTPPPALQLPGSRLKTAFSARNMDLDMEFLLGSDNNRAQQRQQLIDEMLNNLSSPYGRMGDLKPANLDDVFSSPTGLQARQQNMHNQQVRASYPSNVSYGFDSSAAVAAAVMNARSSAFAKRSQSFNYRAGPTVSSPNFSPQKLPQWGSPDGKLEWGYSGEDMSKLRKSTSFGNRNAQRDVVPDGVGEPDVSWVNSLVKDVPGGGGGGLYGAEQAVRETMPHWFDQMCIEQEQIVA